MTGARCRRALIAVAVPVLLVTSPNRAHPEEVRTIPSRPGVSQSFILLRPAGSPVAAVVLFAGGSGLLGLGSERRGLGGNFLVRSRGRFAEHGLLAAAPRRELLTFEGAPATVGTVRRPRRPRLLRPRRRGGGGHRALDRKGAPLVNEP